MKMMPEQSQITSGDYALRVETLEGLVQAFNGDVPIASSNNAKVMYETRLPPVVYFPKDDVIADLDQDSDLNTFCPFKGTARYKNLTIGGKQIENAAWFYQSALPEAKPVEGHIAFSPTVATRLDLGGNVYDTSNQSNISGPIVDWILREAGFFSTPQELTKAIAEKLIEDGIAISRMSVLIWSLHPMIAGKNYIWTKDTGAVKEYTPSYDIHTHPQFVNSPLRLVSQNLGGVRQRLTEEKMEFDFPIMEDLRREGATDYVAMPLQFSDGQTNVMTLTCDHADGFTTANLGLVFEIAGVISRYYEVFNQRENSRVLLETYLGKGTGARVLGGEIRRGDGDQIDAAILFCDLRNSTSLEEKLGRSEYLNLLNRFFEQVTDVINANGGEVLKFIGDAVLAIFPAESDNALACNRARRSAGEVVQRLAEEDIGDDVKQKMDCAIGIAFGGVTYGNVGSRERLDFTVIGSAANIAARLADVGKVEGHRVVMTGDVATGGAHTELLGDFELRNVASAVECHVMT